MLVSLNRGGSGLQGISLGIIIIVFVIRDVRMAETGGMEVIIVLTDIIVLTTEGTSIRGEQIE